MVAFRGVVRDGVIVPEPGANLPDGAAVRFVIETPDLTADERAEFEAWERAGDEAWSMIDWGDGEIARDAG